MRDLLHQKLYNKEWYLKNAEKRRAYRAKYYASHKEQYRLNAIKKKAYLHEYHLSWWSKNGEKQVAKKNQKRKDRRKEILEFLGNKCKDCGIDDVRVLQIDHIEGGGNKERCSVGRGNFNDFLFKELKVNPQSFVIKYQLLCANCNWIKKHNRKET